MMLWVATLLVVAFAFLPNYVGLVFGAPPQTSEQSDDARLASVEFRIEGMTCEGCANMLDGALRKVPGVRAVSVDHAQKRALVRYLADKPVASDRVIEAVKAVGFHADLVNTP